MKLSSITRAGIPGLICAFLLAGCATQPARKLPGEVSVQKRALSGEIAHKAMSLVGRPYRYGGADPVTGFDCSGLVHFVFNQVGIEAPRTVAEQYQTVRAVPLRDVIAGDLLFFKIDSSRISHVAIYAGSGRFVHAPRSGRQVELRSLDDAFYKARFAGAGRLF